MNGHGGVPGEDVILTGIARSGTTLACTLLNRLPGCVALHEPMSPALLREAGSRAAAVDRIAGCFAAQRQTLLARGEAESRSIDGRIPDNPYGDAGGEGRLRRSIVRPGVVRFDKPLDPGFRLVIKHPSCFTALLDLLVDRFRCVAIVRHPLAVLLSWQTTAANWNDGRQPAAEAFDDDLRRRLDGIPDVLGRQLEMVGWSFRQYTRFLPSRAVVRYEDLVGSGGAALAAIDPAATTLRVPLEERNANPLYRGLDIDRLADRLAGEGTPWGPWYPPETVWALVSALRA